MIERMEDNTPWDEAVSAVDWALTRVNVLKDEYPSRELSLVFTKLQEGRLWLLEAMKAAEIEGLM